MSAHETIVTVDDLTTAQLVREALAEGGIEGVELRPMTGVAYMPRHAAVHYEVRVPLEAVERARRVLADFEEEASQAAMREAERDDAVDAAGPAPPREGRMVLNALVVLAILVALLVTRR